MTTRKRRKKITFYFRSNFVNINFFCCLSFCCLPFCCLSLCCLSFCWRSLYRIGETKRSCFCALQHYTTAITTSVLKSLGSHHLFADTQRRRVPCSEPAKYGLVDRWSGGNEHVAGIWSESASAVKFSTGTETNLRATVWHAFWTESTTGDGFLITVWFCL